MDDPPADDESKDKWEIKDDKFFQEYYSGIVEYLRKIGPSRERTIGKAVFVSTPLFPFYWDLSSLGRKPRAFKLGDECLPVTKPVGSGEVEENRA